MKKKLMLLGAGVLIFSLTAYGVLDEEDYSGTYKGKGQGFSGEVWVKVTMDEKKIKNIIVTKHGDTPGIAKTAMDNVVPEIIMNQSLEVDNVAGATYISEGIKEAVKEAVVKAGVDFSKN